VTRWCQSGVARGGVLQISRLGGGVPVVADGIAAQTGARLVTFQVPPSRVVCSVDTVLMGDMGGSVVDVVFLGAKAARLCDN
jgi:hypothetical protein